MAIFTRPDAEIHYEVHGSGYPLLLFAPGGLRSQLEFWRHSPSNPAAPPPWMNPMVDLAGRFTVIGMDQRNAGNSRGTVTSTHGWHTYASDHLALMDHLARTRSACTRTGTPGTKRSAASPRPCWRAIPR